MAITKAGVFEAQAQWAAQVVAKNVDALLDLYNFPEQEQTKDDEPSVLFNPTLLDKIITTRDEACEYFVGIADPRHPRLPKLKKGFLDNQWSHVYFDPDKSVRATRKLVINGDIAIAMGMYLFEKEQKLRPEDTVLSVTRLIVDYTFVYKRVGEALKIIAHHSSLPVSQEP